MKITFFNHYVASIFLKVDGKVISFFSNDVTKLVAQTLFSFLASNIKQRMYGFQMLFSFSEKHLCKQKLLLCLETIVYL